MSENEKPQIKLAGLPRLVMTITIDQAGQCSVQGPINDKIIAYGLLEIAKETIAEHHKNAAKQILVARPVIKTP